MFAHMHIDLLYIEFASVLSGYLRLLLISMEVKKKTGKHNLLVVILLAYKTAS